MSSDEELELLPAAPQPRVRRHKFKNFAERVADVDVDAFRRLGPVREVPSFGASSWTQEALVRWRELNSAEHFLGLAAQLTPLCETLPQLVHHSEQAFQHVLDSMHMKALLSMPAMLAVLAAFARDLQGDFAARMLPRALARLTALIDREGGDREPEFLEAAFNCLALLCKHLARFLLPDLPAVLRMSSGLRYARAPHVRTFAAQAFGFLLRLAAAAPDAAAVPDQAPFVSAAVAGSSSGKEGGAKSGGVLYSTLRALLAEHAVHPSEEVTDGAGRLVGEAVLGVGHGLHSRAPLLLGMALGEDLLKPSDFAHGKGKTKTAAGDGGLQQQQQQQQQREAQEADGAAAGLSREVLRARATAVACVALDRVLVHLRRGRCQELWDVLLKEAHARLHRLEAQVQQQQQQQQQVLPQSENTAGSASKRSRLAMQGGTVVGAAAAGSERGEGMVIDGGNEGGGGAFEVVAAARSAARAIGLVAQAVHHFRGSRVENYDDIQRLVVRLMQPWAWVVGGAPSARSGLKDSDVNAVSDRGSARQVAQGAAEEETATDAGLDSQHHQGDEEQASTQQLHSQQQQQQQQQQREGHVGSKKRKRKLAQQQQEELGGWGGSKTGAGARGLVGIPGEPFLRTSLPQQVLRLLLGIVYGHSKAVGASEGLPGLACYATAWSPAFTRPTPSDLLPFVAALLSPPAGGELARLFGPRMLSAVGSVVLSSPAPLLLDVQQAPPAQHPQQQQQQQQQQQRQQQLCALGVLVDACMALEGGSSTAQTLPLLLTAQPGGVKLAAAIEKGVLAWVDAAAAAAAAVAGSSAGDALQSPIVSPSATLSKKGSKKHEKKPKAAQPTHQQHPQQQQPHSPSITHTAPPLHTQLSNQQQPHSLAPQQQQQLESLTSTEQLSAVWAGLQLLPHASQSRAHAASLCERVKDTTSSLCGLVQASVGPSSSSTVAAARVPASTSSAALDSRRCVAGLVCLHALALELLAELLPAVTAQHVEQAVGQQGRGTTKSSGSTGGPVCMAPQQLVAAASAAAAWLKQQCQERRLQQQQQQELKQQTVAACAQAAAPGVRPQHAQQDAEVSVGGVSSADKSSLDDGAILWSARGVAAVMGAVRRHAMHLPQAQTLLSVASLEAMLQELMPFLAHEVGTMRAAVLRMLCCYDQPGLLAAPSNDEAAAPTSGASSSGSGGKPARVEVLELLRAIACDPCTLEAGRRWSVALIRQGNHVEYGRLPPFMVPVLAHGLIGVLRVRFSPLWPAAVQTLAACLQFQTKVCWPIVRDVLAATQLEFISGGSNGKHQQQHPIHGGVGTQKSRGAQSAGRGRGRGGRGRGRGGGRGTGGRSAGHFGKGVDGEESNSETEEEGDEEGEEEEGRSLAGLAAGERPMEPVEPLDCRFERITSGQAASSVHSMAEVSGEERGSTDAGNRLTHLLRAMAGVPSQVMEPLSKDWAPLLLAYAAAPSMDAHRSSAGAATPATTALAASTPALHGASYGAASGQPAPAAAAATAASHEQGSTAAAVTSASQEQGGDEGEGLGVSVLSRVGTRNYNAQLLEWLGFLAGVKGARGLHRANEIQVAVALHLDADEPKVQAAALKCLQAFKHKYLNQHLERLLRLADNGTLREELTLFPLAPHAEGGVPPEHRAGLMPLLIRLLFPKLRKRSGRLAGRGALGSARAAILNFLASAEPQELRPLLEAFLEPLAGMFVPPPPSAVPPPQPSSRPLLPQEELAAADAVRLLPVPWWLVHLGSQPLEWWLAAVQPAGVAAQPARRKVGFLNSLEDLLEHLGHRLQPLLPALVAITLRLLHQATAPVARQQQQQQQQQVEQAWTQGEEGAETEDDRSREIRSSCLKLLAQVWQRFPDALDYNAAWPELLPAVQPLLPRLLMEAVADKEPPLLSCAFALSASPHLLPVLGNMPSTAPGHTLPLVPAPHGSHTANNTASASSRGNAGQQDHQQDDQQANQQGNQHESQQLVFPQELLPGWARQGLGGALMRSCIAMLTVKRCSQASRVTVLDMVDSILEFAEEGPEDAKQAVLEGQSEGGLRGPAVMSLVLEPWLDELLVALKTIVTAAWEGKGSAEAKQSDLMGPQAKAGRKRSRGAHRELSVLEKLGGRCASPTTALLLGDALAALVGGTTSGSSAGGAGAARAGKSKLDEVGLARALGALSSLWGRLAATGGLKVACGGDKAIGMDTMWRYWETMSGLALRLSTRDARASLASAFVAAAQLLDGAALTDAAAVQGGAVGEGSEGQGKPMEVEGPATVSAHSCEALRAARLLEDLTSWQVDSVDEMNYERRLEGYKALTSAQWAALGRRKALPLLLAAHHDCRNPADLALRQAASQALERFIQGVKQQQEQQQQQQQQQGAGDSATEEDLVWLVPRIVYPQLKSQLASPSMSVRQEHLMLLRTLVLQCPDKFPDLVPLTSPQDPETDFYLNVAHVQLHRRSRALMRMGRLADAMAAADQGLPSAGGGSSGSLRCLLDIAVPLLQVVIGEGGDAKDGRGGHERDQIDADREASVVDAAMGALGAVARALPWHQYDTLLSQFMRALKVKTTKANIRAVCVILDAFHFPLPHNLEAPQHAEGTDPMVTTNAAAPAPAMAATGPSASGNAKERVEGDEGSDEEGEDASASSEARAASVEAEAAAVQRALLQRVLPVMHRLLVQGGPSPVVRAPVALALVKLLRLLPSEVERVELPRALQGIANLLGDRQQRVRDDARHVLVSVAKELGPAYLPYICNVLRAALPDKGFTAHVIGYTLHAVLDALVGKLMTTRKSRHAAAAAAAAAAGQETAATEQDAGAAVDGNEELEEWAAGPEEEGGGGDDGGAASGALDDAVELALPIIENEIFGEVAEAKEVAQFAMNYKEAKKVRGYESFMLLAAGVTFKTSMEPLLDLVRAHLHRASSPSVRNKLSQLLQHAARGVHANPTAGPTALAVWVHRALAGGLEREEAARERAKADVQGATSAAAEHGGAVRDPVAPVGHIIQSTVSSNGKATKRAMSPEDAAALHEYLIVDFALQLLHSSLRRGALSGRSPVILGLLDPLLGLMVRALRCRHSGSVGLALRCLTILVGLPLPSLAQASGAAGKGVTALLKRAPNASHPVALEGFRLLAALLRQCSAYQPTTAQLRFLLSWLFSDRSAEDSSEVGPAFALLRAILGRRLVVPEVYDVMNWVQGLMVRSHSPQVRATCASALLQFLLDYPLGPRRTSEHLTFLASNLSFEHETGRLAVLDMVQQVVCKFPVEVTTANAELFLLPLVMRLVNDPAPKCRAAVAGALRALLAALPTQQHDAFATYCRQWLLGNNSALRRAAAHSLGLLAQVEGKRFGPRLWSTPSVPTTTAPAASAPAGGDGASKPPVPLAAPVLACLTRAAAASNASDAEGEAEGPLVSGGGVEGEEGVCAGGAGSGEGVRACAGWHEAYYCLLMLEKVLAASPSSLLCSPSEHPPSESASPSPSAIWEAVVSLLLHRHMWVRKAAARVIGAGLANPQVAESLLGVAAAAQQQQPERSRAPRIAFSLFLQLDNEAADEVLCGQAVKCLVPVALALHTLEAAFPQQQPQLQHQQQKLQQQQQQQQQQPVGGNGTSGGVGNQDEGISEEESEGEEESGAAAGADAAAPAHATVGQVGTDAATTEGEREKEDDDKQGEEDAEGDDEDEEDETLDVPMAAQYKRFAFTLRGLVKRMARLADNARFGMRQQRMAALRWLGAAATTLGAEGMLPFLNVVLVPLYRLSEAKSSQQFSQGARQGRVVDEEAVMLAEEVLAHLRTLVGSDTLLAAYNAARETIKSRRTDRRRKASVKAMLDPEAAAAARLKRGRKKAEGRKRKMDDAKRKRSAQTYVGPKKPRGGSGKGGGALEGAAAGAHKHAPKRNINAGVGGGGDKRVRR